MRLLQRDDAGNYSLTPDIASDNIPSYAILSHTWGPDEVVFTDLAKTRDNWQQKAGYDKIRFCAEQARRRGLRYFWVDTCCIDKSDNIELQRAINSMFRWYRDAKVCFVYLSDVSSATPWETAFRRSRWLTRGWTLQELIAPVVVEFYSREGILLGNKQSLEPQLRDITGIPASALRGTPLSSFPIAEREAWVRNRQTKYEEDMAYSLLGIFDVHMPLIYGEGRQKAQRRLREEAQKVAKGTRHDDFSVILNLSNVPETPHVVAREAELAEMRGKLKSDGSRSVVVLHGLGGIGKTQLAITYAKRYRDEYSAIFWLNIKDETSIQQSFTQVARQILRQYPDASHLGALDLQQNHEEVVEAVKSWLSLPGNTRWLLVYDNFDEPKLDNGIDEAGIDIGRFLPEAYQGSVIVTTRSSQVNLGHRIRIRKLETIHDGLQILAATSGRDSVQYDVDAESLVKELDGLPLAIATAGAYLRRVPIGFADYLRLYKESWARLHASTPSLGSYKDRTLCSTWQLSYVQIQKQDPLAAHLLRWWAYFDNEDIWFELLRPKFAGGPAWIYELADELNFNSAIGTLHDYGFVEPHISTPDVIGSRGYSIHACVHAWAVCVLNETWDFRLAKLTVECVAASVPSENEPQFWLLDRRLLSHAIKCSTTMTDDDHFVGWAFNKLGNLYEHLGKLQDAEDIFLRALRGYGKALEPDIMAILGTTYSLGIVYMKQGKLQNAENTLLRALRVMEEAWGPDHALTLDASHNLGTAYANEGRLQDAENMLLRALRGYEKAWGSDHAATLSAVHNLGTTYANQGRLQDAEDMYLRVLRGFEKAWGSDYALTLAVVFNLGLIYTRQGNLQNAENMYLRALRGYEKAWGSDYASTLAVAFNLGLNYSRQGNLQNAENMYLRALRGYEKEGESDYARTLAVVPQLGHIYSRQGNLQNAENMYLRALRGSEKAWGPDHILTLDTVYHLGVLYTDQGKLAEAKPLLERAYDRFEALLGPSHKTVQALRNYLRNSEQDTTS